MRFSVVAYGEGKLPLRQNGVTAGREVKLKLRPIPEERKEANHQIKGRVMDPDGKPVVGAEVEATGWGSDRGHTWGQGEGVDLLTVTNEKGEFVITSKQPDVNRDVRITAKGFATSKNDLQTPGEDVKEYTLSKGAAMKGRVVKDGQGVGGVAMQAVQSRRDVARFIGIREVKTAEDGTFVLENLKPEEEYVFAARAKSVPEGMCTMLVKLATGEEGETDGLGEIEIVEGKKVVGKIKMSDEKPVPSGSTVTLSFDERYDSYSAKIQKDGTFTFVGVPTETVRLYPRINGYRPAKENENWDYLNGSALMGLVDDDIDDLVVLMEPGPPRHERSGGLGWTAMKKKRLTGVSAEAK
jgi:hypothetical protein